ncbi:ParM/StbA family protein (plasmid) [Lysinibacillus capsici]|uniref:ParM/StbA family protein n=1 Tax=Lysinibacillus capsici TaxID=2115968 RepID=UPI0021DB0980|nr:ParM/StbA family protein [Lysinibacillus capsici]UYB50405.1 ParM/StbA family protein [Lysinibacillus capsici]
MKVERLNVDFGNSTGNFLSDSYYFEIPTCVVRISKEQAEGLFTNPVEDTDDLLDRLLISTVINDEEHFFMVGKLAETSPFANSHVGKMHDKINSNIPYATFLAAMAYIYKINQENNSDPIIEVDNMKMMLPVWLLKKEDKFSIAQNKMVNRFFGEHTVKLLTPGMETEVTINIQNAKCHIESEVGRWALKYKIIKNTEKDVTVIEKRTEAKKFDDYNTVLVDIGGGSTDAVLLAKGLNTPVNKDSFQVVQVEPYLGRLAKLLKEKLIEYFSDLRGLEQFIVDNYVTQRYIFKNPNTGISVNITDPIVQMLQEYADILVYQVMESFKENTKEALKFIYFGGEAPILEPYIKQSIARNTNEGIMENNHYFLNDLLEDTEDEVFRPTARTINLNALEILSLNEKTK